MENQILSLSNSAHARTVRTPAQWREQKTGGGEDGYLRMGGNKEVGVDRA